MSSSFWLLQVESRDFSRDEKERTACKAEQILQNDNHFHSKWSHLVLQQPKTRGSLEHLTLTTDQKSTIPGL